MLSWAQRTVRWTVRTLPFSIGRSGAPQAHETTAAVADQTGDEAQTAPATAPAGEIPAPAAEHASRHRASHERLAGSPARGRHAAPSRSRRPRSQNAG
jgi:hypothetical protein